MEPLPPKWHTISADIGHFHHAETNEHAQFMVIIDECSRFRTARILTKGSKQQPTAAACLQYLREGWTQYFGNPRCLRLDPGGSFRSQSVQDFCDRNDVLLDIIPGEAHWQIGVCEQAVQGLKTMMGKLSQDFPDLPAEELLSTAVRVFNQRDLVRGFSPLQHAFGRGADTTGRLLDATQNLPDEFQIENPEGEFERTVQRQEAAEKAHAEWQSQQRLLRAKHSRGRPPLDYCPGELVYFWRTQESNKSKVSPGSKKGRFLGPARILATETRKSAEGELRPGSAVWIVRGRQLLKCSPEQIRRASAREELIEALSEDVKLPWTYHRVAKEIGGGQYEDISKEIPSSAEWSRAQDPEQEEPPARYRIRHQRPAETDRDHDMDEPDEASGPSQPQRPRIEQPEAMLGGHGYCWWAKIEDDQWPEEEAIFWNNSQAAVEVEVPMPESQRRWQKAVNNLESYFTGALKRRAVEVNERYLSDKEKQEFQEAKGIEVKNFISAKAFESLPEGLRPDRSQAVGMHWILTWKVKDDGTTRAKARAVLLGYQDPGYAHRATTAPVMTRQSRQLMLHIASTKRWRVYKGDITGAFLQGREYPDTLYCIPCPEICEAMNLPIGSITKLKKACYGLVDAPLEWYRTVSEFFQQIGLERMWSDACMWVWRPQGEVRGMVSGHVDDFLFGGSEGDSEWQEIIKQIKSRFKWGDWEHGRFTQCGVLIEETPEGYEISQKQYVEEHLEEIAINASRRKDKKSPTTEKEKTSLRAVLGGLSWHAQQTAPHISAEVGLLLSEVGVSTVDTLLRANLLVQHTKARKNHKMLIHRFAATEELCAYAWVDAANQNRPDGGSTQGLLIGLGPRSLQDGDLGKITPVVWSSTKIDRQCLSPGSAETQAAVNGEDALFYVRFQLAEIFHGCPDARQPTALVKTVPGCVITDSRNVFDKLNCEVLAIKGAEKKSNLELISLKEAQEQNGVKLRWVHSEAQLSNSLTKAGGSKELELFYKMGHQWKIVEDPAMQSARKRKAAGLEPLETVAARSLPDEGSANPYE